ncbi:hypothetical protein CQ12_29030 [Bradyrhizobium jicamae]|uniref:Cytochrome c domain-containing protein n=1 Tax=Bradyrhizobium jicamae TaxID=280332 RepID=A0A0R3M815_9BRAD|nr:cytochrome c peroxidase [Bradyrhizobium jicamae]KRR15996.1 hypothetical protein CQ12_29030 [Bradyrhizobium jicamae]
MFADSRRRFGATLAISIASALSFSGIVALHAQSPADLDSRLDAALKAAGFTGRIKDKLPTLDQEKVLLGRDLFFDKILALHGDNSCSGCHAPQRAYGDTQSIAIGVDNNDIVGEGRKGPRNQRRSPILVNTAFYPKLMWNGRFSSLSGNPFDNSKGFLFPSPEGSEKFGAHDQTVKSLLAAQGHIPSTEMPEMAGFRGAEGQVVAFSRFGGDFVLVDSKAVSRLPAPVSKSEARTINAMRIAPMSNVNDGDKLPDPDFNGSRNEAIRTQVLEKVQNSAYKDRFAKAFPESAGKAISFGMIGTALAEFQFSLTMADAPLDRFARGDRTAMSAQAKEGALIFFGKGQCVGCHAVAGQSNEMFSDFENHNIGVPPLFPGVGGQFIKHETGNVVFDFNTGDVGLADILKEDPSAKYKFRTSPLRNIARQKTFMHNGTFTSIRSAVVHHLDVRKSMQSYSADTEKVAADIRNMGPKHLVLQDLSPKIANPIQLSSTEIDALVAFIEQGLTDPKTEPANLCKDIPVQLPSGNAPHKFEGC